MVLLLLTLASGLSFLRYGSAVLLQPRLEAEFARYGMPRYRVLVGAMELLGGVGVLAGLIVPPLGAVAAGGLTLLMVLGVGTRLRIHDGVRAMVPAATLAVVNAVLVVLFLSR